MFKEASIAVAAYESEQVFPRGMGIDWKNHSLKHDVEMLTNIFNLKPKILSKLQDDKLEWFRLGAAMMTLWGRNTSKGWLPLDLKTDIAFDVDTAARIFLFHAAYKTDLLKFRDSGFVEYVEILSAQDSCEERKQFSHIKYKLNEVPELPHEHCTHGKGCRCVLIISL